MKILIYGAGVIGSLYAALMAEAGFHVTVLARGKRLADLQGNGLRYETPWKHTRSWKRFAKKAGLSLRFRERAEA